MEASAACDLGAFATVQNTGKPVLNIANQDDSRIMNKPPEDGCNAGCPILMTDQIPGPPRLCTAFDRKDHIGYSGEAAFMSCLGPC